MSISGDRAKLDTFYKILTALEETTQAAIDFLLQQATQITPSYQGLSHSIRMFKNMMKTMEDNIKIAFPTLKNPAGKAQLLRCLDIFQLKQDLRHYAVSTMSEVIEKKSFRLELIKRYQDIFGEANQLTSQIEAEFLRLNTLIDDKVSDSIL